MGQAATRTRIPDNVHLTERSKLLVAVEEQLATRAADARMPRGVVDTVNAMGVR
jgi:hypothetical protein